MKKAFVTGGTGFVGLNLVDHLCQQGWEVTVLHRSTSNLKYLKRFDVKLVEGSINDKASLEEVMPEEVDAVFHVAADINMWHRNNKAQTHTNIVGTRNTIEVALQKKAKCFIHTSSVSAWGRIHGLIDENTPQLGEESWINYEKTKWQAEQEVLKKMGKGMKVVIMNPANIVGPYDSGSWARSFYALRDGKLPFAPPGEGCFVHVVEVVKAHIAAVEHGQDGHKYLLAGLHASLQDLTKFIADILDKKPPGRVPPFLFRFLGSLFSFISNVTQKEPFITRELGAILSNPNCNFSSEKAKRELGFQDVSLEKCVKDCYGWLVKEGMM